MDAREAVFIISVAARLVDMHPSTLRKYERCGLLEPCRLSGRLRLYSPDDIARLRQIKTLVEERGINLSGVEMALALAERVKELQSLVETESNDEKLRDRIQAIANEMLDVLGTGQSAGRRASTENTGRPRPS